MDLTFQRNEEIVVVRILGNNVLFANETTLYKEFYPIDLMSLDYQGIIKEFPDLISVPPAKAREEAIHRFKEHIKIINNENGIKNYLVTEFEAMGYTLICIKRDGFREVKLR